MSFMEPSRRLMSKHEAAEPLVGSMTYWSGNSHKRKPECNLCIARDEQSNPIQSNQSASVVVVIYDPVASPEGWGSETRSKLIPSNAHLIPWLDNICLTSVCVRWIVYIIDWLFWESAILSVYKFQGPNKIQIHWCGFLSLQTVFSTFNVDYTKRKKDKSILAQKECGWLSSPTRKTRILTRGIDLNLHLPHLDSLLLLLLLSYGTLADTSGSAISITPCFGFFSLITTTLRKERKQIKTCNLLGTELKQHSHYW